LRVVFFGTVANVALLRAYGLQKYHNVETMVYGHTSNPKIIYTEDNPFGVKFIRPRSSYRSQYRLLFHDLSPIDIFHFVGGSRLQNTIVCKLQDVKVISEFVGSDLREVSFTQRLFRSCSVDKVITGGQDLLQWIPRKKNVFFVPIPIDPRFFQNNTNEGYSIFSPTRFTRNKGNIFLFKAWKILRGFDKEVVLKLIKWGEDFPKFYQLYSKEKNVRWLPLLSRKGMIKEFNSNYILWCQHNRWGVFGLTVLEGMASSKPIFAGFNKKYYAYFGTPPPVISCSSPEELAEKTYELLKDRKKRIDLGRSAREWVKKNHGLKTTSKKLYNIYKTFSRTRKDRC